MTTLTGSIFSPRSVVIVGASERSAWSQGSFSNFERLGFEGRVHLVNRNGGTVHGQAAFTSCTDIGEPVDLALLLVGAAALPDALRDLAAAGIRYGGDPGGGDERDRGGRARRPVRR